MVARLLFESEVMAMGAGLNNPAEAAYAVVSMMLLPAGMTGLIVVAMLGPSVNNLVIASLQLAYINHFVGGMAGLERYDLHAHSSVFSRA
jgi:cobalamin biosynthesis Co2+ chelatase CbiK